MGSKFAEKKYIDVIVPPLLNCWNTVEDDSPEIFSIFDCFLSIAKAMGKKFSPYAPPIFQRFIIFPSLIFNEIYLNFLNWHAEGQINLP